MPLGPAALSNTAIKIHLPYVAQEYPTPGIFGVEMSEITTTAGLDLVRTSGTRWVRRNALLWSEIEPIEGEGYRWDGPFTTRLEKEMIAAASNNLNLVLIVRSHPAWAVSPHNATCAPINPAKYEAFARFLAAAIERYSQHPYNVRYWEIGNEPDAGMGATDSIFYGCWGIQGDTYYGGKAYGTMLRAIYPVMKAANPNIYVLNGGLLLDMPFVATNSRDTHGRFFEGMLEAGAGNAFDILSFHSYIFYGANGLDYGRDEDWRIAYLKSLLQRYNVPTKPLMRTETALLCTTVTTQCRWAQADYVARSFVRSMRDGLLANIWYVYDGDSHHNTALVEPTAVFVPRPAYFAFRHTARMLSGATYLGPIPNLPYGVEGYRLRQRTGEILVYWTDVAQSLSFSYPLTDQQQASCSNRDGGSLACQIEGQRLKLEAGRSPSFVLISP
jgi:hypothetical protein